MRNPITHVLERAVGRSVRRARSRVESTLGIDESVGDEYLARIGEESGVEIRTVLKSRDDTRRVARGHHSSYGQVALKTSVPAHDARKAYAHHAVAQLVAEHNAPFFPHLYSYGVGYSIEQWVEGRELSTFDLAAVGERPILKFLDELRAWSTSFGKGTLLPVEQRVMAAHYLRKVSSSINYRPLGERRRVLRGWAQNDVFGERLRQLDSTLREASVSKSMMIGDLGIHNVIMESQSQDLFVIDYEELTMSSFIFDLAYLITSLMKRPGRMGIIMAASQKIFSNGYLECDYEREVLKGLVSSMGHISVHINNHHAESRRHDLIEFEETFCVKP